MIAYTSLTIDLLEMEEKMITRTPQKLLKSLHLRKKLWKSPYSDLTPLFDTNNRKFEKY